MCTDSLSTQKTPMNTQNLESLAMKLTPTQALSHPHRDFLLVSELDVDLELLTSRFAWALNAPKDSYLYDAIREDVRGDGALCQALCMSPAAFGAWLVGDDLSIYCTTEVVESEEWASEAYHRLVVLTAWPADL
jgi:hypothetical protein